MNNKIIFSLCALLLLSSCDIFNSENTLKEKMSSWVIENNIIWINNWTWKTIIKEEELLKEIIEKEPKNNNESEENTKWKTTDKKSIAELSEGIESINIDEIMDLELEELLK